MNNKLLDGQIYSYANLGILYRVQKDYENALEAFLKCLDIANESGRGHFIPRIKKDIGETLFQAERLEEAEKYWKESLSESEALGIADLKMEAYLNMSKLLMQKGDWQQALSFAQKGFDLATEIQDQGSIAELASQLKTIHKHFGNTKEAFRMYELEVSLRDSLYNKENTRALLDQELQYDFKKKVYRDSLENAATLQIQAEGLKRRSLIIWFLVGALLLIAISGGLLFSRYRLIEQQKVRIQEEKIRPKPLMPSF